jgi:hypothetical protein
VTEYLADSPVVSRPYCPGCEPDADPMRELLDVRWCDEHVPVRAGSDDERVDSEAFLSGTAEAGGEMNRRWCELFHRPPGGTAGAANGRRPIRKSIRRAPAAAGETEDTPPPSP